MRTYLNSKENNQPTVTTSNHNVINNNFKTTNIQLHRAVGNNTVQELIKNNKKNIESGSVPDTNNHLIKIQSLFGRHNLQPITVEVGGNAAKMATDMDAKAFTQGDRIGFKNSPDLHLVAHEATHVIQQRRGYWPNKGMGRTNDVLEKHADRVADNVTKNRNVENLLNTIPATGNNRPENGLAIQLKEVPNIYPWVGVIEKDWSVAMRSSPDKSAREPHRNTEADLPRGSEVLVIGRRGGWLHIAVQIDGVEKSGYVSQELVTFLRTSSFEGKAVEVFGNMPSIAEAFVILKHAETTMLKAGPAFKPNEEESYKIDIAVLVLENTGKYSVDPTNFQVNFTQVKDTLIEITTIEDFILFVEHVERQFPSAKPSEIASEIRQLWFSDVNWEILVSSEGVKQAGKHVDIETAPNPVATKFDMKKLAPNKGSKEFDTVLGRVDIGHVLSGIDGALSSFPTGYPKSFLASRNNDDSDSELKYKTLKAASGGDTRDFTTWSGDLGQAYAEFLVEIFVKENSAKLSHFINRKAPDAELLGDLHGYIAQKVWISVPVENSPSGKTLKVSNILRDLYLVSYSGKKTYREYFETVSGQSSSALKLFIITRSKAFARPWFAKKAKDASPGFGRKTWLGSATKAGALDEWMTEFDRVDAKHERTAKPDELLSAAVDDFIKLLETKLN